MKRRAPHTTECRLNAALRAQQTLRYDQARWDLVAAARVALRCGDSALEDLSHLPEGHAARGTPPVHRALVEVRKGQAIGTQPSIRALETQNMEARRSWRHSSEFASFTKAFHEFVDEWVLPQFGCDLWVSPATLRVVLPGGIRPSKAHCDAEYEYDVSEVNFCA